jgi:hypothetical protein
MEVLRPGVKDGMAWVDRSGVVVALGCKMGAIPFSGSWEAHGSGSTGLREQGTEWVGSTAGREHLGRVRLLPERGKFPLSPTRACSSTASMAKRVHSRCILFQHAPEQHASGRWVWDKPNRFDMTANHGPSSRVFLQGSLWVLQRQDNASNSNTAGIAEYLIIVSAATDHQGPHLTRSDDIYIDKSTTTQQFGAPISTSQGP